MRDFTQGDVGKSIFLFSLPLILGNLFQQLYTLVNSAFVGNFLGVNQLAAVGSSYPIVFLLTSLIIGIGSGGSVVVSHYFGAKDYENIHKIISTFYIFFISFGLVMCLVGIWFAPEIFSLINLDKDVLPYAVTYFRIYMIGMFFSVCFNSAISILRGLGDSTTQLYFLISANVLNGILSYLFLGIYHYGVASSAWASVISQFLLVFVYSLSYITKEAFLKALKKREETRRVLTFILTKASLNI
jgi:putative MATE family efflux protein